MEFLQAVIEHSFLRTALLAGILAAISSGVIGTFVVTRRMTSIAGSLAHCTLGGMGAAAWLHEVKGWHAIEPIHGAVAAALLAAWIIALVRLRGGEREDTVISALWALGMAIGVLFLARTPGYRADLMNYLLGNIVLVDAGELRLLVALDFLVVGLCAVFYQPLLAFSFDEEFARVRGLNVAGLYVLLLSLCALAVVTLIYVVGIVMVIALLTLPVSIAGRAARRLWHMMVLAALLSAALTTAGLALSYGPDLPSGATTVLLAGLLYVVVGIGTRIRRRGA